MGTGWTIPPSCFATHLPLHKGGKNRRIAGEAQVGGNVKIFDFGM